MRHAPAKRVSSQNTHLHDTPAVAIKPLAIGPKLGPANGASVKSASAFPRVSASQMSEITALQVVRPSARVQRSPARTVYVPAVSQRRSREHTSEEAEHKDRGSIGCQRAPDLEARVHHEAADKYWFASDGLGQRPPKQRPDAVPRHENGYCQRRDLAAESKVLDEIWYDAFGCRRGERPAS